MAIIPTRFEKGKLSFQTSWSIYIESPEELCFKGIYSALLKELYFARILFNT